MREKLRLTISNLTVALLAAWLALPCPPVRAQDKPAPATVDKAAAEQLTQAIRKRLTQGWTVRYDDKDHVITLATKDPVPQYDAPVPIDATDKPATKSRPFELSYRVSPYLPQTAYWQISRKHYETSAKLAAMTKDMVGIPHKGDSYSPRNDAEKAQVEAYTKLRQTLTGLPEFHYKRVLSLTRLRPDQDPTAILANPAQRIEFQTVIKNATAMLEPYMN